MTLGALNPPRTESSISSRVLSVDIFRGLTMLLMVFVNDLASVKGLPWWNYHMAASANGMTYVDMVFPAFLFIVGMSLPLSLNRRLESGESQVRVWAHILLRSLSLIILGLFIANLGKMDSRLTGIGRGLWGVLGFTAAILLWNVYPKHSRYENLHRALKIAGLVVLAGLLALFRRSTPQGPAWLNFSYWEILGLIGHTYLAVCILYVPLRKKRWAPAFLLVVLVAMNAASRMGWLPFLRGLPYWLWPFDRGELPSIVMAGVVASTIFLDKDFARSFREKARWGLAYAAALFAAGWALLPFEVSKIRATPSWCLFCSGAGVILFLALYWILDVRKRTGWAFFVKPAGSNTLLTYLLPDIFYVGLGAWYFRFTPASGWPGVARSLAFTAFIAGAAALLTKCRIRMQL